MRCEIAGRPRGSGSRIRGVARLRIGAMFRLFTGAHMIENLESRTLFAVALPAAAPMSEPPAPAIVGDGGDAVGALRIKLSDILVSSYRTGGATGKVSQHDFHFVMKSGKVSTQDVSFVMKHNTSSPK